MTWRWQGDEITHGEPTHKRTEEHEKSKKIAIDGGKGAFLVKEGEREHAENKKCGEKPQSRPKGTRSLGNTCGEKRRNARDPYSAKRPAKSRR